MLKRTEGNFEDISHAAVVDLTPKMISDSGSSSSSFKSSAAAYIVRTDLCQCKTREISRAIPIGATGTSMEHLLRLNFSNSIYTDGVRMRGLFTFCQLEIYTALFMSNCRMRILCAIVHRAICVQFLSALFMFKCW